MDYMLRILGEGEKRNSGNGAQNVSLLKILFSLEKMSMLCIPLACEWATETGQIATNLHFDGHKLPL